MTNAEWKEHAMKLRDQLIEARRERDAARAALRFIAEEGGKTRETECGDIRCDGDWCAEQARTALWDIEP